MSLYNTNHYGRCDGETAEEHAERLQNLLIQRDGVMGKESTEELRTSAEGLDEAESFLASQSQSKQPQLMALLNMLQDSVVYTDSSNRVTNRKLWDSYALEWGPNAEWVQKMAGNLPRGSCEVRCVGDEWSEQTALLEVLENWLFPIVSAASRVAEIGSGGGRVSAHVAPRVQELVCFDISAKMLEAAKLHLSACNLGNVCFEHLADDQFPASNHNGTFDVVFAFDVFVHLDLHQMRDSLTAISRLLRPGGHCFISFASLLTPGGWTRFSRQKKFSVGGFYFVSPDIVHSLMARAGLEIVRESTWNKESAGNTYLNRDLLVVARAAPSIS